MGPYPELENLTLDELIAAFNEPPPEGDDSAVAYYSELAWLISQQGEPGIQFLRQQLPHADEARLLAILPALANSHEVSKELLQSYLSDSHPMVVAEAVRLLAMFNDSEITRQVLALRDHTSPYVRGSVLFYLSRVKSDEAYSMLIEALGDSHFIVREFAVDELDNLGKTEAIPCLKPLLNDTEPDVRQAAQTAIENLEALKTEQGESQRA